MFQFLFIIVTLGMVGHGAYVGYKSNVYGATLRLVRTIVAFTAAMTFSWPLAAALMKSMPSMQKLPWADFVLPTLFFLLLLWVYVGVNELIIRFLPEDAELLPVADKVIGPVIGGMSGALLAGCVLITWSLLPLASYFASDMGVIRHAELPWDAGLTAARFYQRFSQAMHGPKPFILYDEPVGNLGDGQRFEQDVQRQSGFLPPAPGQYFRDDVRNGEWDHGFLFHYYCGHWWTTAEMERLKKGK